MYFLYSLTDYVSMGACRLSIAHLMTIVIKIVSIIVSTVYNVDMYVFRADSLIAFEYPGAC